MSSLNKNDHEVGKQDKTNSEIENENIELDKIQNSDNLGETVDQETKSDLKTLSSEQNEEISFLDVSESSDHVEVDQASNETQSRSKRSFPLEKQLTYGLIGLLVTSLLVFFGFILLNDSEETKVLANNAVQGLYFNQDQHYLKENITQEDIDEAKQVVRELNFINRRPYENELVGVQEKYNLLLALNNVYNSDQLLLNGNQQTPWETFSLQADASVEIQEQHLAAIEALEQDPMIEDIYNIHQHALMSLKQINQAKELVEKLPIDVSTRAELPEAVEKIKQVESEIESISHHPQMEQVNQQLLESANRVGQVFIAGADLGDYDSALEEAFYDSKVLSKTLQGSTLDDSPLIALTFDDGPNEEYTTQLLDVLAKHDVKATFFVMGAYVDEYPEVAMRIVEEGHVIANHTYNHHDLSAISDEEVLIQFEWTQESIEDATGVIPDTYRLPFGAGGKRVIDLVPDMTSILWNLDSMDWESHDVDVIYDTILTHLQHHTLLLMHDTHQATPDTIDLLIPELKERGYSFVMPEELEFDMRYFAE